MTTPHREATSLLRLRRGEGRWLDAGRRLRIVLQHGSLHWKAAPLFDGLPAGEGRLTAGDSSVLYGWLWLQADRDTEVLCLAPAPAGALWREAARAAARALHAAARVAAATLQRAGGRRAC
ncbi:hypothetical protein V4F39_20150 [Aquincola sp. MAHUQ-54]|uniref:Uncharacterized protein n=1 Tax=Aquincola agrisoli TaxID=3119538 RepID=A0AAW9QIQ5_9BURK